MRALLQRVTEAAVLVGEEEVGHIGPGLLVLLGVAKDDDEADAKYLTDKLIHLRIFADQENRFQPLRPGRRGGVFDS